MDHSYQFSLSFLLFSVYHGCHCNGTNLVDSILVPSESNETDCNDSCAANCYNKFRTGLGGTEDSQPSLPFLHPNRFTEANLKSSCSLSQKVYECGSECADGPQKTSLLRLLASRIFMCNESDFLERSTCYRNVIVERTQLCDSSDKCHEQVSTFHNFTDLSSRMDRSCNYLNCYLECLREPMVERCSEEGYRILKTVFQKWIPAIMDRAGFYGVDYTEPDSCNRLKTM